MKSVLRSHIESFIDERYILKLYDHSHPKCSVHEAYGEAVAWINKNEKGDFSISNFDIKVWGWKENDDFPYLIALHEIGHTKFEHGLIKIADESLFYKQILEFESEAWLWANENTINPISDLNWKLIDICIYGYVRDFPNAIRGKNWDKLCNISGGIVNDSVY